MPYMSTKERMARPDSDFAWPDAPGGVPKFPITSQEHLDAAVKLLGRAPASVQARIISIAKRKGYSLPDTWQ